MATWLTAAASGLASGALGLVVYMLTVRNSFARERYERLIAPLFFILEPHLYRDFSTEARTALGEAIEVYVQYRPFAGARLMQAFALCESADLCAGEAFRILCRTVDRSFDFSSLCFGLPLRSIAYRINYRQYGSKAAMYLFFFLFWTWQLVVAMSLLITAGWLLAIYQQWVHRITF